MSSSFLQSASDTANATSYTFSSQSFGTAAFDRTIRVGVVSRKSGGAGSDPTVTIGGVAATKEVVRWRSDTGGTASFAGFYRAFVPAGTAGDVVVDFGSSTMARAAIAMWRITGGAVVVTDTDSDASNDPDEALDIPVGGGACAIAMTAVSTTTAWTGLTERVDAVVESAMTFSAASDDFPSGATAQNITADFSSYLESVGVFVAYKTVPAKAAVFDGVNHFMWLGTDQAGGPHDSKKGLLNIRFCWDGSTGEQWLFAASSGTTPRFGVYFHKLAGYFTVIGYNSAGTEILRIHGYKTGGYHQNTWYNVLASWDLATGAAHVYVNDEDELTTTTLTNDTIDYSPSSFPIWAVNMCPDSTKHFGGRSAVVWFHPATYMDLSVESNRRKFVNANGGGVPLGEDGELPLGTAPLVYHCIPLGSDDPTDFLINRGSGSDMALGGVPPGGPLGINDGPPS